jgi:hypothetical protein
MTTREKAHKLLDELPESEIEPVVEFIVSRGEDDTTDAQDAAAHKRDSSRSEIDAAIIASYTQIPQEDLGAGWAAHQSILQEPWGSAS